MLGKWKILFWLILFSLLGSVLTIILVPKLADHHFWIGFVTSIIFVSIGIALINWLDYSPSLKSRVSKLFEIPTSHSSEKTELYTKIIMLFGLASIAALFGFLIFRQLNFIESNNALLEQDRIRHINMMETVRQRQQMHSVHSLIDAVERELLDSSNQLSYQTIKRIIHLSKNLIPYSIMEGDSLSEKKYSPERGMLLTSLIQLNLDSASWMQIKKHADFSHSKLSGSLLDSADLSYVNLSKADLSGAQLNRSNLSHANLTSCVLINASLQNSKLSHINLEYAKLAWSDFSNSEIQRANLNATDLSNAKFDFTDLSYSEMKWANLHTTSIRNSILNEAVIYGSTLHKTILVNSVLNYTNLSLVDFEDADFSGTTLQNIGVGEENWKDLLVGWNVSGVQSVITDYVIEKDTSGRFVYILTKPN